MNHSGIVGDMAMTLRLTEEQERAPLLVLAEDLGVPKVRDVGLPDSAAFRPQSSLMGQDD